MQAMRVLLVEDDTIDAKRVTRELHGSARGAFEVTHARHLQDALARLSEGEFTAALVDLSLPDSDGPTTVRRIQEAAPNMPVVVLTGRDDVGLIDTLLASGIQDYITKGRETEDVLQRSLRYAVERQRLMAELKKEREELKEFVEAIRSGRIATITGSRGRSNLLRILDANVVEENERLLKALSEANSQLEADVAERRRAEATIRRHDALLNAINTVLHEALACDTDEAVARTCLAMVEELTGSAFGFIGEVGAEGRIDTIALSDPGWSACRIPRDGAVRMLRDMEPRGFMWKALREGRSVIVNDPAQDPERVGTPEGHPALTSFMAAPLNRGGKTFGMIALANKPGGYDLADQEAVEALSVAFAEALMHARLEQDMVCRNRELEKSNRVKDEFLAKMSHELRTPLNSIIGFTEMMMHDAKDPPVDKRARRLEKVHRNARDLLALVNDILDISKIEGKRLTLRSGAADLRALVDECVGRAVPLVKSETVKFTTRLDESLAQQDIWCGDSARLQQVIMNLLSNAAKFTEQGRIELRASVEGGELLVQVEDTGIGVPAEHLPYIFDEFHQVDSSSTRRAGGSGLGLSISRKLCRLMGGDVTVSSREGDGSCFTVRMPVEQAGYTSGGMVEQPFLLSVGSASHVRSVSMAAQSIQQRIRASVSSFDLPHLGFAAHVDEARALCARRSPTLLTVDPFWQHALRFVVEFTPNQRTEEGAIVLFGERDGQAAAVRFHDFIAQPLGKDTLRRVLHGGADTSPRRVAVFPKLRTDNAYLSEMLVEFDEITIIEPPTVQACADLAANGQVGAVLVDVLDADASGLELANALWADGQTECRLLAVLPREPSEEAVTALSHAFERHLAAHGEPIEKIILAMCMGITRAACPACSEGVVI